MLVECGELADNGRQMKSVLRLLRLRDLRAVGVDRTLRGLRTGDQREVYLGLAALAYLGKMAPRRRLIYRKTVPVGSAIVISHRRSGDPKIEVIKPGNGVL
jgi:hypothetical protein